MNRCAIAVTALGMATMVGCPEAPTDGPVTGGSGGDGASSSTTNPSGGGPASGGGGNGGAPSNVCVLDTSNIDECVLQ